MPGGTVLDLIVVERCIALRPCAPTVHRRRHRQRTPLPLYWRHNMGVLETVTGQERQPSIGMLCETGMIIIYTVFAFTGGFVILWPGARSPTSSPPSPCHGERQGFARRRRRLTSACAMVKLRERHLASDNKPRLSRTTEVGYRLMAPHRSQPNQLPLAVWQSGGGRGSICDNMAL